MIAVSTLISEDGVLGLNGKRYLLDDGDEVILFKTKESAKHFVMEHGEDPDNEYIEYEEFGYEEMADPTIHIKTFVEIMDIYNPTQKPYAIKAVRFEYKWMSNKVAEAMVDSYFNFIERLQNNQKEGLIHYHPGEVILLEADPILDKESHPDNCDEMCPDCMETGKFCGTEEENNNA